MLCSNSEGVLHTISHLDYDKSDQCVMVVGFKMKFWLCFYRQKNVYHKGKRGISWHGAMVSSYVLKEVNRVQAPVLHKIYMDHIIENENKRDVTTVFCGSRSNSY
jgi:hypothetical protein